MRPGQTHKSRSTPGRPGAPAKVAACRVTFHIDPDLTLFLRARPGEAGLAVDYDGTSSVGHGVESLGVPLTEVGEIRIAGHPADDHARIPPESTVTVLARRRPQPVPDGTARVCLDGHLGTLARRLRLVGLDSWYRNDTSDDDLIATATAENRVLLTKDRALLRRRAVRLGAYVRGDRPDEQLCDVLDRFAPALAPWTRCPACNGHLDPVPKAEVEHLLLPGTRRTYSSFARCRSCGRPYWHGAHGGRLDRVVERARRTVARRISADGGAGGTGTAPDPSGTPAR